MLRMKDLLVYCGVLTAVAACSPPASNPPPAATVAPAVDRKLLTGTRLYPAPDEAPIEDAWVYVEDGRIKAVGSKSSPPPPDAAPMQACSGGVIAAGFQNSHVHFTEERRADAA